MSYHLLQLTTPKARKVHRCIWCGEDVIIGETYKREKSVYDGAMQDFKWHLECWEASQEELKRSLDDCFDSGINERPEKRLGLPQDG